MGLGLPEGVEVSVRGCSELPQQHSMPVSDPFLPFNP